VAGLGGILRSTDRSSPYRASAERDLAAEIARQNLQGSALFAPSDGRGGAI